MMHMLLHVPLHLLSALLVLDCRQVPKPPVSAVKARVAPSRYRRRRKEVRRERNREAASSGRASLKRKRENKVRGVAAQSAQKKAKASKPSHKQNAR